VVSAFLPFADRTRNHTDLVNLCSYTRAMLLDQRPRVHSVSSCSTSVAIFTDGSGKAIAGAVLIDGQTRLAFKILVFFPFQRLHGFRQVVTHIQSRQTVEL